MVLAQVVADQLGVEMDQINVVFGDTGRIPFGVGTFASRSAVMAGSATMKASEKVRQKATRLAAHLLEASYDDIEWAGGSRPVGMEPGLEARHYHEQLETPFSFGVHLCEVEVDPETVRIDVRRYIVVNDCGRMINPMIVEGQIAGGIAQGLGGALLEELVYEGGPAADREPTRLPSANQPRPSQRRDQPHRIGLAAQLPWRQGHRRGWCHSRPRGDCQCRC